MGLKKALLHIMRCATFNGVVSWTKTCLIILLREQWHLLFLVQLLNCPSCWYSLLSLALLLLYWRKTHEKRWKCPIDCYCPTANLHFLSHHFMTVELRAASFSFIFASPKCLQSPMAIYYSFSSLFLLLPSGKWAEDYINLGKLNKCPCCCSIYCPAFGCNTTQLL